MTSPMQALKDRVQGQKDEIEQGKDDLEARCKEVAEERAAATALEQESTSTMRRLQLMEGELEVVTRRLKEAEDKLVVCEGDAEDSESKRQTYESQVSEDRSISLQQDVKETREAAHEADTRLSEAERKLKMVTTDLQKAEERADQAEAKVKVFEVELETKTGNLDSLQKCEGEVTEREETFETRVRELVEELKEKEGRVFESERSILKLEREKKRLEGEIDQTATVKEAIKEEMGNYFKEFETL